MIKVGKGDDPQQERIGTDRQEVTARMAQHQSDADISNESLKQVPYSKNRHVQTLTP